MISKKGSVSAPTPTYLLPCWCPLSFSQASHLPEVPTNVGQMAMAQSCGVERGGGRGAAEELRGLIKGAAGQSFLPESWEGWSEA